MSTPRERLIEAGLKLFYRDGFHATGIDTVLAEAGVAKKTLYAHFKSKEELILAVMQRRDEDYRNWFTSEVEKRSKDPINRILACFDVVGEWVRSKAFYGCACINASAEFANKRDPVHKAAANHKAFMIAYLRSLIRAARLSNPQRLSRQLLLLIDGAVVVAQVTGQTTVVADAKSAAEIVVREAQAKRPSRTLRTDPRAAA
jgi:AcrR family transcriptional regulator